MCAAEWRRGPRAGDSDEWAVPEQSTAVAEHLDRLWRVILYNDNWHTFDEVIQQLQKATGCSVDHASHIADEVHTRGRATAYTGEKDTCKRVASVLREIQLQVESDEA